MYEAKGASFAFGKRALQANDVDVLKFGTKVAF